MTCSFPLIICKGCIHSWVSFISIYNALKYASSSSPSFNLGTDVDTVREWVRLTGRDWGYVVLIAIDNCHNFN